jgi:hypothetical protein
MRKATLMIDAKESESDHLSDEIKAQLAGMQA